MGAIKHVAKNMFYDGNKSSAQYHPLVAGDP